MKHYFYVSKITNVKKIYKLKIWFCYNYQMVEKIKTGARIKTKVKAKRKKISKKHSRLKIKLLEQQYLFIVGIIFLVILTVLLFSVLIYTHLTFAANFADNILRPTIGNQATISIEAFFFRIEDKTGRQYPVFYPSLQKIFDHGA